MKIAITGKGGVGKTTFASLMAYVLIEQGHVVYAIDADPNATLSQALGFPPEIAAQVINETYYWLPNDAALPLVDPEIRDNTAIFPTSEMLRNAEILLPLSPEGEALHQRAWERFLAAGE